MNEMILKQFENNQIRIAKSDINNIWFVAKDIMDVLDIRHVGSALRKLQNSERDVLSREDASGRKQEMAIVNESGLYSLIFQSRKKEAAKFRYWITNEVLPSIRKTGSYSVAPKREMSPLDILENHVKQMRMLEIANDQMASQIKEVAVIAKQETDTLTGDQISELDQAISTRFKELDSEDPRYYGMMRKAIKERFFKIKGSRTYKEIRRCDFPEAIKLIKNFMPPEFETYDNRN